ncbi:hypothetical protein A9Q84_14795 [Halobacteriovorax marinus]|uniref:Uncharacterized protein n=1 Tax=Halobacteriovorax marinus TaxID=97084 RepID=A0A1Y5F532_9BACT|nr:hypothetical protein A9Q84_14795 [Halobacteriovorax marinus]
MSENLITLQKDRVIEIAFASVKDGGEEALFTNYFPNVMPILTKYGGAPIKSLKVTKTLIDRNANPQMISIFGWDSLASFDGLHNDEEFKELVPIRDSALDYLNNKNFFKVDRKTTVELKADSRYDLIRLTNESQINKFKKVLSEKYQDTLRVELTAFSNEIDQFFILEIGNEELKIEFNKVLKDLEIESHHQFVLA